MGVPCVRVARADGEATRRRLAEADLVDDDREIVHEDGWLYLPVVDPAGVPADLDVVERSVPAREGQATPADLLSFDPSYERVGDVVVVDEDDPERAREIADAIVESSIPARSVLNRASKVKGETRVRDWDVLVAGDGGADGEDGSGGGPDGERSADRSPTETVHREYGCEFLVDLDAVYFSPRLATERHRVAEQVREGERAFDMFAGVGPFAVPFAVRGAEVVGVDVNETAIEYLRTNAERNGVADRITAIAADVREVADDYADWADRIVMNLPHSADDFLDATVAIAGDDCLLHYYDIQHEDDPFGPGEGAIRDAAETDYDVTVENERVVRSYAPHEQNVVLDVRLTR